MIALLTNRFVVGGILIALASWWVYDRGYSSAETHYTAIIAAEHAAQVKADLNEQRRQTIANNAAKKREAEAIAAIEAEQAANTELRRRLASEARQDPDADHASLGAGSVQRINQIR